MNLNIKKAEVGINKPKNYLILSIVGAFWIVVLTAWFAVWPLYSKAQEIGEEAVSIRSQALSIEQENDAVKEKERILTDKSKEIERLNVAFPKTPMEEELMLQLEDIVDKAGIGELKTFSATATAETGGQVVASGAGKNLFTISLPGYSSVEVPYSGEAKYADFKKLLLEIEKNLRLMTVTQVTISSEGDDSGDPVLKLTLAIQAFYGGGEQPATTGVVTPGQ